MPHSVAVIDYRRRGMLLAWHPASASWSGLESSPQWVHGVALIRGTPPNICLYGFEGRLILQIGTDQHVLDGRHPRVRCARSIASLGLRCRFWIEGDDGKVAYRQAFWAGERRNYFAWLAHRIADPGWCEAASREWSSGVTASVLRSA